MTPSIAGIIPVMLTPFTPDNQIDWPGYERLIEWYIDNGAEALFAVCMSSEMHCLTFEERIELARFAVKTVKRRVPVVASGHVSKELIDQRTELAAMAETGVDGVVLVTNRLVPPEGDSQVLRDHIDALLRALPAHLPLGLYECPVPYRRLLTDSEIDYCAQTGRFSFIKDVSCDLQTVKRRLALTKDTPLSVINANAAIAWPALQAGASGFCGVMTNLHPDLYRWLQDHGARHPEFAEELATFLVLVAMCETMGYPKLAKVAHQRLGTFAHDGSRAVTYDLREKHWAFDEILAQIEQGTARFRDLIARFGETI
ncbi:MAG: dihydrodipicolinate synthase family protein [Thiohalobacterales bacterium]|nr:dihydrodipicolinate synthase family protein [Thiohalobacterales bacterium]